MAKAEIPWRYGWATSKLYRLPAVVRARRFKRIAAQLERSFASRGFNARPYYAEVRLDLTKKPRAQLDMSETLLMATPVNDVVGPTLESVVFTPVQFARAPWRRSESELKAHKAKTRKLARRYKARGQHRLADGLLRGLVYHPTLEVSLGLGHPDIRGGLDTGHPSTYQTYYKGTPTRELVQVQGWTSILIEGRDDLGALALSAHKYVDMLVRDGIIKSWRSVLKLVIRRNPSQDPLKITIRDWRD